MDIFDAHCDTLSKLYGDSRLDFYKEEEQLDVNYPRLQHAGVKLQFFAIYLSESISPVSFDHILQFIDIFHKKIVHRPNMLFVKDVNDLHKVMLGGPIGAVLSLEGADAIAGNISYVRVLFELGVRFIGITWNYANWAADGVMEPRRGGLTIKGKQFIKEMDKVGMIKDVSHLSVKGFWELAELSARPFIASHSNAWELCAHPRNLSKDQIKTIIQCSGRIGLTFVPYFIHNQSPVRINQLLTHLDHICSLGGERHVGFGSDFDGIEHWIENLENAGKYDNMINELCKRYKEDQVKRFLSENWKEFLYENLPRDK